MFQNQETLLLWSFYQLVMHMQRELYLLAQESKQVVSRTTLLFFETVAALIATLKKAHLKKSFTVALSLHESYAQVHTQGNILLEKNTDAIVLHRLLGAARQCYLASSPLMGLLFSEKQ